MPFASSPISSSAMTTQASFITTNTPGDNLIVPAQGVGVRIRVLGLALGAKKANDIKFRSGTTDISCLFFPGDSTNFLLPINDTGWLVTEENQPLNINLAGTTQVGCHVIWIPSA